MAHVERLAHCLTALEVTPRASHATLWPVLPRLTALRALSLDAGEIFELDSHRTSRETNCPHTACRLASPARTENGLDTS